MLAQRIPNLMRRLLALYSYGFSSLGLHSSAGSSRNYDFLQTRCEDFNSSGELHSTSSFKLAILPLKEQFELSLAPFLQLLSSGGSPIASRKVSVTRIADPQLPCHLAVRKEQPILCQRAQLQVFPPPLP
ncbi:hypothetical protein ACH5RR_006651 [Cinchona calisaya]|uniref:Uncharacterized protein n=1 Tax=Cinchona calisaya TaxID=153742 RepID=A0ABD3APM5_9GENT